MELYYRQTVKNTLLKKIICGYFVQYFQKLTRWVDE